MVAERGALGFGAEVLLLVRLVRAQRIHRGAPLERGAGNRAYLDHGAIEGERGGRKALHLVATKMEGPERAGEVSRRDVAGAGAIEVEPARLGPRLHRLRIELRVGDGGES